MKANALDTYLNKRFSSVEKNLHAYGEDLQPRRLHRLRLDIKKLRAVLSFIKKTYKKEFDISRLKSIFKRAGELRDNQLHIRLLEEQPSPSESLLTHLENQKNGRKGAFKIHIAQYIDEVRQVQESIAIPSEKLTRKKVKKYFEKRLKKARKDIGEEERGKAHSFRKRIKNVLYLYKALPKKIKKKVKLDADYLDKVQERVGDWHDTRAALNYITETTDAQITAENRERLKAKETKQFEKLISKMKVKRLMVGAK